MSSSTPFVPRFGYVPNDAARIAFENEIRARRPLELRNAAPAMMNYGQEGDVMPYLAYYEVEIKNPDGSIWKAKGDEPPYESQTGNNCTGKSTTNLLDLLQCMDAAQGKAVVHRTACEAVYAFGLSVAGMRGDNGCYGSALAKAVNTIGAVDYATVGSPYKEDHSRLLSFARDPSGVVSKYKSAASGFKCDEIVKITTIEEALAWFANQGLIILPSNVGFATLTGGPAPRDANGIVKAFGMWPHQMFGAGVLRSDGNDTIVFMQSWGPDTPSGPQPFKMPSFSFRVRFSDFQKVLNADDVWGIRALHAFEPLTPTPVPTRWTSHAGWFGV